MAYAVKIQKKIVMETCPANDGWEIQNVLSPGVNDSWTLTMCGENSDEGVRVHVTNQEEVSLFCTRVRRNEPS
jgi:hypothetical protein